MGKKIIIIFLICIGVFLRLYHVTSLPAGFFLDEVNMAVDVKTLVENGTDQYGKSHPFTFEDVTDYKLPVYVYLSAVAYKLLGAQLITVRIVALIASLLSIISFGYLTKLLFKDRKLLPYLVMIVVSLSPFAVHFARIGYETTLATFLLSVFLIAFLKAITPKSQRTWFVVGILAAGLATWTYPAPRFIVPLFIGSLFLLSFFKFRDIDKKRVRVSSLVFFAGTILFIIPTLLFSPTATSRSLSYIFHDTKGSGIELIFTMVSSVVSSFLRLWNVEFLFGKGDTFAYRHGTKEVGIFLQLFLIPYLIGLLIVIRRFRRNTFTHWFTLVFTIIAGLPSALTAMTPYGTRIVPLLIPYSFIIALGIDWLLTKRDRLQMPVRFSTYLLICLVLLYQIAFFAHSYFSHFPQSGAPEFPSAPTLLGSYLKQHLKDNPRDMIYFLNDRSCRNWAQDTLHFWYFADLPNKEMITWNNLYRQKRYETKTMSPFDAYDGILIPQYRLKEIPVILYPGYASTTNLPKGTLFVRCGFHVTDKLNQEKLLKVFYISEQGTDPYYVVTEKI